MQKPPYFWRSLLSVYVLLPLLFQVLALGALILGSMAGGESDPTWAITAIGIPVGALFLWHCVRSGRHQIRMAAARTQARADTESCHSTSSSEHAPERFGADPRFTVRYLPVLLPASFTLLVSLIVLLRPAPAEGALFGPFAGVFTLTHIPACLLLSFVYLFGVPSPWLFLLPPLAIYAAYGVGLVLGFRELGGTRTAPKGRLIAQAALLVVFGLIVWRIQAIQTGFVSGNARQEWLAENSFNIRHRPFDPNNTLVKVAAPTLQIADAHPTLDGATALFPVYAAAAQALYTRFDASQAWRHIRSSTTPKAYARLIAGEVDLVFVAQPSATRRGRGGGSLAAAHAHRTRGLCLFRPRRQPRRRPCERTDPRHLHEAHHQLEGGRRAR